MKFLVELTNDTSNLLRRDLHLCTIENDGVQTIDSPAWERPSAEALHSILTMPFENAPPLGYSNLENALQSVKRTPQTLKNCVNTV